MVQEDLFLREIYDFLRTVTILNKAFAVAAARDEAARRKVDSIEPYQNPYYLHLLGLYVDGDEKIYIKSMDFADTTILFDNDILRDHPKTKFGYTIPNRRYYELVSKYPQHVDLIKNILYPVALRPLSPTELEMYATEGARFEAQIIKTCDWLAGLDNYTLLAYDATQLETTEFTTIIHAMQQYLQMIAYRWDVPQFDYENFYAMVHWTIIWTTLPNVILLQRTKNLRTTTVHSKYIWEYLTSNGLSDYRSILTREQQLFLYKNMDYLIKTRGKDNTLTILADKLLRTHSIELRSKTLICNTTKLLETGHVTAEIISSNVNDSTSPTQDAMDGYENIYQIVQREHDDGLEPIFNTTLVSDQQFRFDHTTSNVLPTKLLELNKIKLYAAENERFIKFIFESMLYHQSLRVTNYLTVVRAADTEIDLQLTPGEVIALLAYSFTRSYEQFIHLTEENIDTYIGQTVITEDGTHINIEEYNKHLYLDIKVRYEEPTYIPAKANITQAVKNDLPDLSEAYIWLHGIQYGLCSFLDVPQKYRDMPHRLSSIESPVDYMDALDAQFTEIMNDSLLLRNSVSTSYHLVLNEYYRHVRVGEEIELNLGIPFVKYKDWFATNPMLSEVINALDSSENPKASYAEFANLLLIEYVPIDTSGSTSFTIFSAEHFTLMKQLFIQLCSYNIAFLDTSRLTYSYIKMPNLLVSDMTGRETDITHHPDVFAVELMEYREHDECTVTDPLPEGRLDGLDQADILPIEIPMPSYHDDLYGAKVLPVHLEVLTREQPSDDSLRLPTIVSSVVSTNPLDMEQTPEALEAKWPGSTIEQHIYHIHADVTTLQDTYGIVTDSGYTDDMTSSYTNTSNYVLVFVGYINIPETGQWEFETSVASGNSRMTIDRATSDISQRPSLSATIGKGLHPFTFEYEVSDGQEEIELIWNNDSIRKQAIPMTQLYSLKSLAEIYN